MKNIIILDYIVVLPKLKIFREHLHLVSKINQELELESKASMEECIQLKSLMELEYE